MHESLRIVAFTTNDCPATKVSPERRSPRSTTGWSAPARVVVVAVACRGAIGVGISSPCEVRVRVGRSVRVVTGVRRGDLVRVGVLVRVVVDVYVAVRTGVAVMVRMAVGVARGVAVAVEVLVRVAVPVCVASARVVGVVVAVAVLVTHCAR